MNLLISIIVGLILSIFFKKKKINTDPYIKIPIYILLFSMGLKTGDFFFDHPEYIKNIYIPVVFTLFLLLIFVAFFIIKKIIIKKSIKQHSFMTNKISRHELISVSINLFTVIFGIITISIYKYFYRNIFFLNYDYLLTIILYFLLVAVGFDIGLHLFKKGIKGLKFTYLFLPFLNIILTSLATIIFFMIIGFSLKNGFLVSSGFGWYSLSSVLLAQKGFVILSVYSFVHNLFREIFSILLAPFLAKIDPLLLISAGGATSMDVLLPFVKQNCGAEYTLPSFYSGTLLTLLVPFIYEFLFTFL